MRAGLATRTNSLFRDQRGDVDQVMVLILLMIFLGAIFLSPLIQPFIDEANSEPKRLEELGIVDRSHADGHIQQEDAESIKVTLTYFFDVENTSDQRRAVDLCGLKLETRDGTNGHWKEDVLVCPSRRVEPRTRLIDTSETTTYFHCYSNWNGSTFTDPNSCVVENVRLSGAASVHLVDSHPIVPIK